VFSELQQVLLNFVINAEQAFDDATRPRRLRITCVEQGDVIRIEVADSGPGIRTEDEPKLFQPFFTTKPVGQGTGLGLSVSYGIIESCGGEIGYHTNEWGGATFYFELPAAADIVTA
jgi:C4-dicarboxylate-specific signal transduction histidine kinase